MKDAEKLATPEKRRIRGKSPYPVSIFNFWYINDKKTKNASICILCNCDNEYAKAVLSINKFKILRVLKAV